MNKKLITDKTFKTYITLVYDCTEIEFLDMYNKITDGSEYKPNNAYGKTILYYEGGHILVWINRKDNMETLAHELLHIVHFWLCEHLGIKMSIETEEIYTTLHSFYMRECMKVLGLSKYTAK